MAEDEQAIRQRIVTSAIRRAARGQTVVDPGVEPALADVDEVGDKADQAPTEGVAWSLLTHLLAFGAGVAGAWLWMFVHTPVGPSGVPAPTPTVEAAAKAPPPVPSPAKVVAPDPLVNVDREISDLLFRWMEAWTQRDVDAYLAFYSPDFRPADGGPRERWASGRRQNLRGKSVPIRLSIHDLVIVPTGPDEVNAVFLQDYASGGYRESKRPKTMQLRREESGWKIIRETQQAAGALDEQP